MCRRNEVWQEAILNEIILISFLVFIGKIVVGDALLQKLSFDFVVIIRNEHMILVYCCLVVIRIGGDAVLHFKEIVGVAIHIRFGSCGQTYHDCIEIFEDGTIFFENAAVAFVDDNKVKVRRGKQALPALRLCIIDCIQHCRVGGKNDSGAAIILIGAEIAQRHIRQVIFKVILCLFHQCSTVSQK